MSVEKTEKVSGQQPQRKTPVVYRRLSPEQTIDEIEDFLRANYMLRYNVVLNKTEFKRIDATDWQEMEEYTLNSIARDIRSTRTLSVKTHDLREVLTSNFVPKYDPIVEYFTTLPAWDGETDYIGQLLETVTANNPEKWKKFARKWIVSMVGCAVKPQHINQTVLVFIGKQGIGKTSWLKKLVPPELIRYYYEGHIRAGSKEAVIQIAENFLVNLDEMDNLMKGEGNAIKQLVTQTGVNIRRPYTRYTVQMPRRASFTGSINHKEFLTDPSGNRRYLCFETTAFDYLHEINMNLVYAQAYSLFTSGFVCWLTGEDIREIEAHNKDFQMVPLEEEILNTYCVPVPDGEEPDLELTTTEVLRYLSKFSNISVSYGTQQRMGKALTKLKFKRVKRRERYVYQLNKKSA